MRIGETIAGRYRLDEIVGTGGMGAVWRATDQELRRDVAMKRATTGDGEQIRREARIGAGLRHPHVITVFDTVVDDGERWLVMEYLPSRSLAEILRTDGPLSPSRAAQVGAQIAGALAAMHASGMVHRDVTPANILVADDGTAKLTDLGIAVWANVTETGDERVGGTPGFMAPEVVQGHAATPASDVYALGATLSAAVEGGEERTLAGVLPALAHREPASRPTADEARKLLLNATGHPRRVRMLVVAAGLALLLVAVGVVVVITRPSDPLSGPELVGDPRTADPCALADENAVRHIGSTKVDRDYSEFNRCDILVAVGDDEESTVDIMVKLDTGPDDTTGETLPSVSAMREIIETPHEDAAECRRLLLLPGEYRVVVVARYDDGRTPAPCTIADAMFTAAKARIGEDPLPRRDTKLDPSLREGSLAGVDACDLLETGDVTGQLGSHVGAPQAGFANWNCAWLSQDGNRRVLVAFDRVDEDVPEDSIPARFGRRDGYVQPEGWGPRECLAAVRFATYDSTDEDATKVEEARVYVRNDQPSEQRCENAKTLATEIARRLP